MGRIGRSFQLVGQSYRILMQDKELMVLPLVSGVITASTLVAIGFSFGLGWGDLERHGPDTYLPLFLMYVACYTVGIFFQAAVVAGATERMRGGDPTVLSALATAGRRLPSILMWALVAATVGVVLRAVQERVGVIGRIIVAVAGATWSLATFFIVPVLVLEERSIGDSFRRSVGVFKQTWGETVVGGVSLSAAAACAWLTLMAMTGLLAWFAGPVALVPGGIGAVMLLIFFSALDGVYVASLYRYATEKQPPPGFDRILFEERFVPKKR